MLPRNKSKIVAHARNRLTWLNAILDGTDYVMLSGESKRSETDVDT